LVPEQQLAVLLHPDEARIRRHAADAIAETGERRLSQE
jgi:hypothetical protein